MGLGLILFFAGTILAGANLGVMSRIAKNDKRMGWTPQLIFVNALMVIFVLMLLTGIAIIFRQKWWLALLLLFVIMPIIVRLFSGEDAEQVKHYSENELTSQQPTRALFPDGAGTVFFNVDDTLVKLVSDGKEVSGFVVLTGKPYPIGKAIVEGRRIPTPADPIAAAKALLD